MKPVIQYFLPFGFLCMALVACNGSNVNEKIQKVSEKAGQAVSEVAKGVSKGVKSSYGVHIDKTDSNALKPLTWAR